MLEACKYLRVCLDAHAAPSQVTFEKPRIRHMKPIVRTNLNKRAVVEQV